MKSAAITIRSGIQGIMETWEAEVKREVPASRTTEKLVLYDHLPNILENMSQLMERMEGIQILEEDHKFLEILENSEHHGRHRAISRHYDVEQVIREYILLNRVLTAFLRRGGKYNTEVADFLRMLIENAILKSSSAFSRAIREMQEKLVGTLAHDIRNPISSAILGLQMLSGDIDATRFQRIRSSSEKSIRKALELLEGLMDGITVRAGQGLMMDFSEIDLVESLDWVREEAEAIPGTDIKLKIPNGRVMGVFDGVSIRRLLENLLTNAIKYGEAEGPITIELEDGPEACKLSVHNMGEPIPSAKRDGLFEFLSSGGDRREGYKSWGMGLLLVKLVAEAHGGSAHLLESTRKGGTTFMVELSKNYNTPGRKRAVMRVNDGYPD